MADAPEKTSRPRRFSFARRPPKQVQPGEDRSSFSAGRFPIDHDWPFDPPPHAQVRREICVSPTWKKKDKQQPTSPDVTSLDLVVSAGLPGVNGEPRRLTKKQPLPPSRRASIASSDVSQSSQANLFSSWTSRIRSRRASVSHDTEESSRQAMTNAQQENGEITDAIGSIPQLSNAAPERFGATKSRDLVSNNGPDMWTRSSNTQNSNNSQHVSHSTDASSRPGSSDKNPTLRRAGISFFQTPTGMTRPGQPSITNSQATENTRKGRSKDRAEFNKSTSATLHRGLEVTTTKTDPKTLTSGQELEYDSSDLTSSIGTTVSPLRPPPRNPRHVVVSRHQRDGFNVSTEHNTLSNHSVNVVGPESKTSEFATHLPRKQNKHRPRISSTSKTRQSAPSHPSSETSANDLDEPPVLIPGPLKSSESIPTTRRSITSNVPHYTRTDSMDKDSQHLTRTSSSQPPPEELCLMNDERSSGADGASVQTNTGLQKQKYLAKIFVICCNCKSWHDLPSDLYARMVIPETFSLPDQLILSSLPGASDQSRRQDGANSGPSRSQSRSRSTRQSMLPAGQTPPIPNSTVTCCWCNHSMSRSCCSGWTTLVHLLEKHH